MHPKNSKKPLVTQSPLLTRQAEFHTWASKGVSFFTVPAGLPVADALNEASNFLAAGESVISKLMDGGFDANDAFCIRMMIEAAKALVDSTVFVVEFGNRRGGTQ